MRPSPGIENVIGCYVLAHPAEANDDGTHFGNAVKDIFGKNFGSLKIAHLSTADGVGIELFQFSKPKTYAPDNAFEYWRTGIFHICLTAVNIEATAKQIAANGGKQMSKVWKLFSNKDYKVCYCCDPWGTIIGAQHQFVRADLVQPGRAAQVLMRRS